MKFFNNIISKPSLVIFAFVLLSFLSLITITNFIISLFLFISFSSFAIGYALYIRKWFLSVMLIVIYIPISFIFFIIHMFLSDFPEVKTKIVGENFYIREIKTFTKISINPSMKMIAKRDTLYYYWNLKDYDAECLYFGSKELIHEIIEVLKNNKDFKKVKSLKMPTIKGIEDELNIKEIHLIFRKEIKGKERIYMAFDSTNTKVYYSAVHYE